MALQRKAQGSHLMDTPRHYGIPQGPIVPQEILSGFRKVAVQ